MSHFERIRFQIEGIQSKDVRYCLFQLLQATEESEAQEVRWNTDRFSTVNIRKAELLNFLGTLTAMSYENDTTQSIIWNTLGLVKAIEDARMDLSVQNYLGTLPR